MKYIILTILMSLISCGVQQDRSSRTAIDSTVNDEELEVKDLILSITLNEAGSYKSTLNLSQLEELQDKRVLPFDYEGDDLKVYTDMLSQVHYIELDFDYIRSLNSARSIKEVFPLRYFKDGLTYEVQVTAQIEVQYTDLNSQMDEYRIFDEISDRIILNSSNNYEVRVSDLNLPEGATQENTQALRTNANGVPLEIVLPVKIEIYNTGLDRGYIISKKEDAEQGLVGVDLSVDPRDITLTTRLQKGSPSYSVSFDFDFRLGE